MAIIICNISAWQYWRTPPLLRDVEIDVRSAPLPAPMGCGLNSELLNSRKDAREADQKIQSRLLTELKAVVPPVHVMVEDSCGLRPSRFTVPHAIPKLLSPSDTVSLGAGLYVLTPEATLCLMGSSFGSAQLAKMICEACGIFALVPQTERLCCVVNELVESQVLVPETFKYKGIYGYSDSKGIPLGGLDDYGEPLDWIPSFNRRGQITDLWKRPALTNIEHIKACADRLGIGKRNNLRKALEMSANGAASPAEAKAYLMLCSGALNGGESWGRPDLNRRVYFTPEASKLAHQSFCIADMFWPSHKADLEVQGEEYHADDLGFKLETGRNAALESMGHAVAELTYEQMADLDLWDTILPTLAAKTGFGLSRRTSTFLKRREELHFELFGKDFEPCA